MRFLIIGCGSMGKRRIRCLKVNHEEDIIAFDTRADRREEVKQLYEVTAYDNLQRALDQQPDVLIISVPPALHMQYCLDATRRGLHWFCESPLTISLEGVREVVHEVKAKQIIAAPGNQMLFHAYPQQLRQHIQSGAIGPVLTIVYDFGQWLPDWHPYEDYRSFYASKKSLGGGNLDVIAAEIGRIRWIVGSAVRSVMALAAKRSSLEMDVPDTREIILEFEDGIVGSFHFDLIQRPGGRTVKFITEAGTAVWDSQNARIYLAESKTWKELSPPTFQQYEELYYDEIGHFLQCLRGEATWEHDLNTAVELVKVLVAIEKSQEERRQVYLEEIQP